MNLALTLTLGAASSNPEAPSWVDPLAHVPFYFRWQSHRGDGVPWGMYQDDAGTTLAADGDPVGALVDDFNGGTVGIRQSNAMKKGVVATVSGVPVLRMDYVDDAYVGDEATELTDPYALVVLSASSADRALGRVINLSTGGPFNYNRVIHPRRPSLPLFIDGTVLGDTAVSAADFHTAAIVCNDVDSRGYLDGVYQVKTPGPSQGWERINLGAEGFYPEPAGADIIAVMAFNPDYLADVEAYLNTLKPA